MEGTDKDSFTIDSSGNLRFSGEQDFETDDELDITIVATDDADPPEKGELEVTVTLTDVDDPPEITGSESLTFSENTSDTTVLATYSAHDPEGVTSSFTWSLSGADSRDFDLSTNGELTFKNAPNFEGPADSGRNNEYNVNIRANDGSLSGTLAVTITVNDVNEAPTISGDASLSFAENTAVTRVLDKYSATDPERSSITWTLGGTDPGAFTIDSDGDLHFDSEPDFENPTDLGENNVYEIQVVAEDDGNLGDGTTSTEGTLSASFDVTVTVTPVNEPPTVSGQASHSVNENVEDFSRSYTASDPEGSASTFTWSLSGTDGGDFSIDRNKGILTFRNAPNYESPVDGNRDNEYLVQVRASDGQYTGTLDVTIDVDDVNEPPTITGSATPPDFPENSVRSVATYWATDPERSTINWSLGGDDSGDFNISGAGVLTFASIPDFENPADDDRDNEYLVQVRASDGTNTAPLDVTVNVINSTGTEEPTITTTSNPSPYQENGTGTVYTFRATDPQRGTLTWSLLGTDAGDFTITRDSSGRGVLTFNSPPDFENPADANRDNVYEIGVLVTDEQGLSDRVDVAITVTNHAESLEPTISSRRPPTTWRELDARTVYTFRASDPQRGPITWSLEGDDRGDFTITPDGSGRGVLAFSRPPDFESPSDSDSDNVYEATVVATDEDGDQDKLSFVITVTDVAEDPAISTRPSSGLTYHNLTYPENRTSAVYTYSASDPQRGAISWSVTGTDADDFTITGDSSGRGVLTFSSQPDYENPSDSDQDRVYELTVVATDEQRLTDELDVRVTVTDVNEGPEISRQGSAPGSVPENQAQDTVLARYTATDPEGGTVSRWRTSGRDGGDFVTNEQGELRFRSVPDYERPADSNQDNIYEFTVQVSDGRNYGSFDETLTVTPVNEPPTITTTGRTEFTQPENRASRLYTWRATDPEGGSTIRWSLGGTDSRFFTINERGEFSFAPASPPDFEQPGDSGGNNVYNVAIQVSDDSSPPNTASLPVTVTVTDANEEPEVTGGGDSFIVQENRDWAGTTFTARDPEDGTVTRWALGGRDGGDFQISNVGLMTFRRTPDFERPDDSNRDNIYEVEIRPYDGRYYGSHQVTVTVENITEITGNTAITLAENFEGTLATYSAGGRGDLAVQPAWRLTGTDGGDFAIEESGQLAFRNTPDHERPADSNRDNEYVFTVQASDGRYYGSHQVMVTVEDVTEITGNGSIARDENFEGILATYTAGGRGDLTVEPTWRLTGTDGGDFAIDENGQLAFRNTPDHERPSDSNGDNEYLFTVQASDGRYYDTFGVTVMVTPVNEPPTITTTSRTEFTQPENRTSRLYTWRATDPEGGSTITWSLGGVDSRFFTINQRGEFSFAATSPPDFDQPGDSGRDNVYNVAIQVSDDSSPPNTESLAVTVTVTDVNEGPEIASGGSRFTVQENQHLSEASFTANDPEGGEVTRWNLGGRDGGDFTITETGEMSFRTPPDYEQPADSDRNNIYEVEVRPYDGRYYGTLHVTVTVTPVNEPPTITTTSTSATTMRHPENRTSRLYTYRATDPERGTIAWSLAGDHASFFAIDEQRGELYFSDSSPPDFEDARGSGTDGQEYQVTVRASDGSLSGTLAVTVTVTDVNEGPEVRRSGRLFGSPAGSVPENQAQDTALARYTATDPEDNAATITLWSTSGRDGGDFVINEQGRTAVPKRAGLRAPR